MRALGLRLYRGVILFAVRPYIRRELPGWGILYKYLVDIGQGRLWRDVEPQVIRGKLHGYEMVVRLDSWSSRLTYFLGRFHDLPTQLVLRRVLRTGDTFVDVGANAGMMSLVASRAVGVGGKVVAFEPNPGPRAAFEENVQRNRIENIEIRPAGLGAETAELELFVPDRSTGEGTFTKLEGVAGTVVRCPVLVGDEALAGTAPRLIKIDVEGFENKVLLGLRATLEKSRPHICMEMIAGHLARDGSSHEAIANHLHALGYEAVRLEVKRAGLSQELELIETNDRWVDGDYLWVHTSSGRAADLLRADRAPSHM